MAQDKQDKLKAIDKLKTFFSGASQPLTSLASSGLSFLFSRALMRQQNKFAIDAFNRENARQDYLLANGPSIQRTALKNAGYSAADPNGTGFAPPSTNTMDTPSQQQFSIPDFGNPALDYAQFRSTREQIRAQELSNAHLDLENQYLQRKLEAEIGKTEAERKAQEFQNNLNQDIRPQMVETATETLNNLKKTGQLTDKQIDEAVKTIGILDEQLSQAKITTKHYDAKVLAEIDSIKKQAQAMFMQAKASLKNADSNAKNAITQRLAYDLQKLITEKGLQGISVNPSIWQSILNLITSGKADEVVKGLIESYHKINAMLYPEKQAKSMTEAAMKSGNYLDLGTAVFFDIMAMFAGAYNN